MQQHEEPVHDTHMLSLARAPDQRRLLGGRHQVRHHQREVAQREAGEHVLAVQADGRCVHEQADLLEAPGLVPRDRAHAPAARRPQRLHERPRALERPARDEHVVVGEDLEDASARGTARAEDQHLLSGGHARGLLERHAEAVTVRVVADQARAAAGDRVHRADAARLLARLVHEAQRRLLVRDRHVRAEDVAFATHAVERGGELIVRGLLRLVAMG